MLQPVQVIIKATELATGEEKEEIDATTSNSPAETLRIQPTTQNGETPPRSSTVPKPRPYSHLQGAFGHDLQETKANQHFRIILQNFQRLPVYKISKKTEHLMHNLTKVFKPDVTLGQDIGLNWQHLPAEDQWYERCYNYHATKQAARFHHNSNESGMVSARVQWGGTGIIIMHDALARGPQFGADETNLGRWTWVRIQRKEDRWLRIVSAYRPVKSTDLGSSYRQQERYFRSIHTFTCPRKQFLEDLAAIMKIWLAMEDHIIVGIDANEDVRHGSVQHTMNELGLRDIILELHPGKDPPETCYKNRSRVPIDGLFATHGIVPSAGGYTRYDQFCVSDHRGLWVDIPFQSALGYNPPHLNKMEPKKFQAGKPEQRDRYTKQVIKLYKADNNEVQKEAATLRKMVAEKDNPVKIKWHHHALQSRNEAIRLQAADDLHTVFLGKHEWSPKWQGYQDAIVLWTRALKGTQAQREQSTEEA